MGRPGGFVMRMVRATVLAACLVGAGCASVTPYLGDDPQGAKAQYTFAKGYEASFGRPGVNFYFWGPGDADCEALRSVASFTWTTAASKTMPGPANQRLLLFGKTNYIKSTQPPPGTPMPAIGIRQDYCISAAEFVPQPGHRYAVRQIAPAKGDCYFEVIDEATGQAPPTFRITPVPACAIPVSARPVGGAAPPPPAAPLPQPRPTPQRAGAAPEPRPLRPAPTPAEAPLPRAPLPAAPLVRVERPPGARDNSVEGRGLLTREGQTRTCAGREARIFPVDEAGDAFMRRAFGPSRSGLILSTQWASLPFGGAPPVTTCDSRGGFVFRGLPDGAYYLAVVVSFEVPSARGSYLEQRGGTIVTPVTLAGGGVRTVEVAN